MTKKQTKWAKLNKELSLSGGSELDDAQESLAAFGTMLRGRDDCAAHATETWSSLREEVLAHEHSEGLKAASEQQVYKPVTVREIRKAAVLKHTPQKVEMAATGVSHSVWQGPFVDSYVLKKAERAKSNERNEVIKIWSRRSTILPQFVGLTFGVYNGKNHIPVTITEEMVGQKFGQYSPTRTYYGHAGKRIMDKVKKPGSKK